MDVYDIFGYVASLNACCMMIPQVYLTIKSNSVKDLSIHTVCLNLLTQCLFFPYSIHNKLYPLIAVNSSLSFLDILLLSYYFFYIRTKTTIKDEPFDLKAALLDESMLTSA
jgi:uncharacterized protein with PQ loop repeat